MNVRGRWVAVVVCGVLVAALSGCQMLGLESRASRIARELKAQNEEMAMRLAAAESRAVSAGAERDRLKTADLDRAKKEVDIKPAPGAGGADAKLAVLTSELSRLGLSVSSGRDGKTIRLSSDILFLSGRSSVKPEAKPMLSKIAGVLKKAGDDVVIYVDGHTDSDPLHYTKKQYGDNYGLASARAKAVAEALAALGLPKAKLVTRSFGPDRPIADNSTDDGKKQNRRVELNIAPAGTLARAGAPARSLAAVK